jgi:hypothetical protein
MARDLREDHGGEPDDTIPDPDGVRRALAGPGRDVFAVGPGYDMSGPLCTDTLAIIRGTSPVQVLSLAAASYTSEYLASVPVEWYGEATDPSTPTGHAYLQQPTAQQQALYARYGSLPFVDIGNRYVLPQAQYLPSAPAGLSWTQVAAAMRDPSSAIARHGAANGHELTPITA